MRKNGFTLVELSIVLVIIGLLIGGILVGQSLIESAKIQKFVRTLQQYDIAHNQFKNKYKQIPGDTSLFPITGYSSPRLYENDGRILPVTGAVDAASFTYEVSHYWKHLFQAGMIPKDYNVDATTGIRAGTHIPDTPFTGVGLLAGTVSNGLTGGYDNMFFIGDFSATTNNNNFTFSNFATPATAAAIDNKIDDGKAFPDDASSLTGNYNNRYVRLLWQSNGSNSCTVAETNGYMTPSREFSFTNADQKNCMLWYIIGSSSDSN